MRLRNVPGARQEMLVNPYVIQEPDRFKGVWSSEVFHNDHPLHIEIGTGKGQFLMAMAELHPDINYIGIEKYSSVLFRALQKRPALEQQNLFFLRLDAEGETGFALSSGGGDSITRVMQSSWRSPADSLPSASPMTVS